MRLRILLTADTLLRNPYTLYVVRSRSAPIMARGEHFAEWAMGPWRAALLARRLPDGSPAFEHQAAGDSCTASPPSHLQIGGGESGYPADYGILEGGGGGRECAAPDTHPHN